MNRLAHHGDVDRPLYHSVRVPDLEVCWACAIPFRPGFCFGSADGRLLFTDAHGKDLYGPTKGSISGEAINGVAGLGNRLAITTRSEVNLVTIMMAGETKTLASVFPSGAHGVIATASGYFVSPLGRAGLMVAKPETGDHQSVTVITGPLQEAAYFYRVICLKDGDREVLACATRKDGVAAMEFRAEGGKHDMTTVTFDGLDVVDVCPLSPGEDSLGVAAVGKDGSLILFRDVLTDKKAVTMKYNSIEGVAYRLLSCRGDLYLLTSKGLYVLASLAARAAAGDDLDSTRTAILKLPVEAIDANLYHDQWLLVVALDEVRLYDVAAIHDSGDGVSEEEHSGKETRSHPPTWRRQGMQQVSREMSAAV